MTEWLTNAWHSTAHFFTTMPWEMWGVWTLTISLMIVGIIGYVVPLLPGPLLIFAAGIIHTVLRPE